MFSKKGKLVVAVFVLQFSNVFLADPILELSNGKIQGKETRNLDGRTFYQFKGIPFAKPPLGELRFKAPQEVENWTDVLDVGENEISCIQVSTSEKGPNDSEDCLLLNVYTPKLPDGSSNPSLPVMVNIYGGAFYVSDKPMSGPDFLMNHDVILVQPNYRLGPFGFLSTSDSVIPGNYGLKDQQLALKWVQKNIAKFGGDPNKVTIQGESAGAASVGYQLLSPASQGLFRAAILQSGTSLSPWSFQRSPKDIALKLIQTMDSKFNNDTSSQEILAYLQKADASDILKATVDVSMSLQSPEHVEILQGFFWAAVLEPAGEEAFITEPMWETLSHGDFIHVPTLMGICSEEVLLFAQDSDTFNTFSAYWDEHPEFVVPEDLHISDYWTKRHLGQKIIAWYVTENGKLAENIGRTIRYWSDAAFNVPQIQHAELARQFNDVFFYQFSYSGKLGKMSDQMVRYDGADDVSHWEDTRYLFGNSTIDLSKFPAEDLLTIKRMTLMWANFITYLDPTPNTSEVLQNIKWPKVDKIENGITYLNINSTLEVLKQPKAETYQEFANIHRDFGKTPFDTFA